MTQTDLFSQVYIHEIERGQESQQHLDENRDKFKSDAEFLLSELQKGKRLSAMQVVKDYGIDSRRLRDLYASRSDIKREWVLNEQGKQLYKQYYYELPV